MLDLSTLEIKNDTVGTLELLHPATGEKLIDETTGKPITIDLVSADSKDFVGALHKVQNQTLKKALPGKRLQHNAEEVDSQAIGLLSAATRGWNGIVLDGTSLTFTGENAKILYTRLKWVREQVDAFVAERANFLGR